MPRVLKKVPADLILDPVIRSECQDRMVFARGKRRDAGDNNVERVKAGVGGSRWEGSD